MLFLNKLLPIFALPLGLVFLLLLTLAGCVKTATPAVKVQTLEVLITRTPNIVEVTGTVREGVTLDSLAAYRLEVIVPEHDAYSVAPGKAIYCVIEATGEKCDGQVDEVIPAPDTVLAKISLKCRQPLQPGQPGRAQLLLGERFAMFVPKEAVHARDQLTYVFIADAGKARRRVVRTGKTYLAAVEILTGEQDGDRDIIASDKELSDGQTLSP